MHYPISKEPLCQYAAGQKSTVACYAIEQEVFFSLFFFLSLLAQELDRKPSPPKPPKGLTLRQDDFCPILTESHIGAVHKLSHLLEILISTSLPPKIRFQVDSIFQLKNESLKLQLAQSKNVVYE